MNEHQSEADRTYLYRLLGELNADMKHVLRALETNRTATAQLQNEMRTKHDTLQERLIKVEKFNVRVLAYASAAIPVLLAIPKLQVSVPGQAVISKALL